MSARSFSMVFSTSDTSQRALLASDGEMNSVTDLALSYGFTHLSRIEYENQISG